MQEVLVGVAEPPVAALASDAVGGFLDAIVAVERELAALTAFRARLVEGLRDAAGVAELAAGAPGSRSRDVAYRSVRAELAVGLHRSERVVDRLLADSAELVHHLPTTLAALSEGRIDYRAAERVCEQARSLGEDGDARAEFDRQAAVLAQTAAPSRLPARLAALRERLHERPVSERHREAAESRFVRVEAARDGMAWLTALLPAVEAYAVHARLTDVARAAQDGEEGAGLTRDQLRADLLVDLLVAAPVSERAVSRGIDVGRFRGIRPTVLVTVPVSTLLGGDEPAELDGYGPIDAATARELTANAPSLFRLLVDPHSGARLDLGRTRYQIPTDLRMRLRLRDETCRFPGCGRDAADCDLDHTRARADGGESRTDNLAHLCRNHHTLKHHGGWHVTQTRDGTLTWHSPHGRDYTTRPAQPTLTRTG